MSHPPAKPPRRARARSAFIAFALSALFVAALTEVALRALTTFDADGNAAIGHLRLRPFALPRSVVASGIETSRAQPRSYLRYDATLGWSVRPGGTSSDGRYRANASGLRSGEERRPLSPHAAPGTLRIALFGDSFTHGDDVAYAESWGAVLEALLARAGQRAEVLNFGVPGYGLDQALLRFRAHGRAVPVDHVLLGFQRSDVRRNLNLVRPLYNPRTGIPFAKPRFVLDEGPDGERLALVNTPTPTPEALLARFDDFAAWPLLEHERFYRAANYRDHALYRSRLFAFVASGLGTRFTHKRRDLDFYGAGGESRRIADRIVDRFAEESAAAGAHFAIVHLPPRKPLARLIDGRALRYAGLLDGLRARHRVIDPSPALVARARTKGLASLFAAPGGHYSADANRVVADVIAQALGASVPAAAPAP